MGELEIWVPRGGKALSLSLRWNERGRSAMQMLEVAQSGGTQTRGRGRCTDDYLSARKCPLLQLDWDAEPSCADFPVPTVPRGSF